MKSTFFSHLVVLALAGITLALSQDSSPGSFALHRRHSSLARSTTLARRCKPRNNSSAANAQVEAQNNGSSKSSAGLLSVQVSRCGPNGATKEVTKETGPNGSIDFLNCGIEGQGWNPPRITIADLKTVNLADAIEQDGSPFKPCKKHLSIINKHANSNNIPPIIIASIAMQESSCNEKTIGGAGEQGLMQLTKDKCDDAPGGNCLDVDFNVGKGTKYLKSLIDQNGGSFLPALGGYNGWEIGMDVKAAKTRFGGNCRTQRNLDYLFQNLNVWFQNKNVYGSTKYGKYFNLDSCSNQD
ncbi:glycoside hydrolase family 23 protein [Flagelloscypha sp. PMI_526]|nr:glycoside hydrolase family 23 protein [Flagelloscypha sp. PMI_526]